MHVDPLVAPSIVRRAIKRAYRPKAPALVRLRRKSRFGPSEEDRAWRLALAAARGHDQEPLPVYLDGHRLGWVLSEPWWAPARGVYWRRELPGERRVRTPLSAAFTTYDALINAMTLGQKYNFAWQKAHTTAGVANNWYDLWPVTPNVGAYGGSANTAKQINDTIAGTIWHDGNKSADTKHLVSIFTGASANTCTFILYDRVLTYEACTFTASNVVFTNGVAAQRYIANGEGGLKIMCTGETALGATASNLTQLRYTDQDGNTLQSMPTSPTVAHIVSAAAPLTSLGARIVAPATAAATLPWGPYIPLAVGDGGARLINDRTWSAANTGTVCWVLMRPLAVVPCPTAGVTAMMDTVMQLASLERIYDGAGLSILAFMPATTAFTANGGGAVAWD